MAWQFTGIRITPKTWRDIEVTWVEYVDALCCRFGGKKNPLEELTEHKQEDELESYIKDFDILWNRAQIFKRQALVFFLGAWR